MLGGGNLRGNKWSTQILDLTVAYSQESDRPNISGLSSFLQVSRQCIYDWAELHDDFRIALNNMKHGAIDASYKVAEIPKSTPKDKQPMVQKEPPKPSPPVFIDELGDDEEWEFDD
jgi:hypothetical protein